MRDGKYKAGEAYFRMKQSLTDPNEGSPQMWDLPAFAWSRRTITTVLETSGRSTPLMTFHIVYAMLRYGRVSVMGTILSKRRIAMLIEDTTVEKKNSDGTIERKVIPPTVRGWDDPRPYTLVALHPG